MWSNKITPADISDPTELVIRAGELSAELDKVITPGFEALVVKASRGIDDTDELTYIRKDGSRFPAIVSVTALRDADDGIIGDRDCRCGPLPPGGCHGGVPFGGPGDGVNGRSA